MKKFCFYAVAFFATATLVSSCQKEQINPKTDLSQLSDSDLAKKIGDFRTQVLDAKKSGNTQTITFGDAIYLMEAVFNYYHGFTGEEYSATVTETITLPVNYNTNDEISFTELNSIFVELNNTMVEKFEALKLDNKRTMMFDVELAEEGLQVLMTAGSIETNKVSQECINEAPFGATDYWKFGTYSENRADALGKCGQYAGLYVGSSDAKWEQEKAALKYRRGNYSSVFYYFAGIQTIPFEEPGPQQNIYWAYGSNQFHNCIDPQQMNQNYQIIGEKIDLFYTQNNISPLKQFCNIDLRIDALAKGEAVTFIWSISFGEKKQRTEPPVLPSEL